MAPKNVPPAAKQAKILDYFRTSANVFTFKELEKLLPSISGINGMQVKEYLQYLQDDNAIRVEKIGSGNWYWCFMSDAKNTKENTLNQLMNEEKKLMDAIEEGNRRIEEEIMKREDEDEMLIGEGVDREALLRKKEELMRDMDGLDGELKMFSESDPKEMERKVEMVRLLKASTQVWTDNIESLESFVVRNMGLDRSQVVQMMEGACGDEFVAGEGLKELTGP